MSKTDKDICILRNPPGSRMNVPQIKYLDVFGIVAIVGWIFHCIRLTQTRGCIISTKLKLISLQLRAEKQLELVGWFGFSWLLLSF